MKYMSCLSGIPRWTRVLLFQLLLVVVVIQFTEIVAMAQSSDGIDETTFAKPTTDTGMASGLVGVVNWVFWIFYLCGAIFLGIGCFKLKQGDIPGFGTNVAGGVALFFVPSLIHLFLSLGSNAAPGS